MESQIRMHGFDPKTSLVLSWPRPDERTLRTEDILALIAEHGNELALVMFSGVQFYTGQLFEMEKIAVAAHAQVSWLLLGFFFCC